MSKAVKFELIFRSDPEDEAIQRGVDAGLSGPDGVFGRPVQVPPGAPHPVEWFDRHQPRAALRVRGLPA